MARVRGRLPHRAAERRHAARVRGEATNREVAPDRAALLPLAGRDPRRRRRPGHGPARRAQPPRAGFTRRRPGDGHQRSRADPLRLGDPLHRLPRTSAAGSAVRRAPWADPQRRRPRLRGRRHAPDGRVRGRLDQARAFRRDRHEQEVRRRYRRPVAGRPGSRPAQRPAGRERRRDRAVAADARARARDLARLGGDRRARARSRRTGRPPARQARAGRATCSPWRVRTPGSRCRCPTRPGAPRRSRPSVAMYAWRSREGSA